MSDYSDKRLDILARLEIKQIQRLILVLSQATLRGRRVIKNVYLEQASNFEETMQFLQDINWIEEHEEQLFLTDSGVAASKFVSDDAQIRIHLIYTLSKGNYPYQKEISKYLCCFCPSGKHLTHRPSVSERAKQRPIRDFLMDMRVVSYQAADDKYLIEGDAADFYVWAINFQSATRESFEARAKQNIDLGFNAEVAVLNYEKARVGTKWSNEVEHTSLRYPFACYDIKSITLESECLVPRYIEVKAVSGDAAQFYWSRQELEVAQLLGPKYFLYLLPVTAGGKFDIGKMIVINDPYNSVYRNTDVWKVENDAVICSKRI